MEYKIDKKFFEEIMNIEDAGRITIKDNCIYYSYGHCSISLNSFFFKCKDWAYELGYELKSWKERCEIIELSRKYYIDVPTARGFNEIDAVIKACSLIFINNLNPSHSYFLEFMTDWE